MSDNQYEDLDGFDNEGTESEGKKKGGLREYAEKQAAEAKRLQKELEELRAEQRKSKIAEAVRAAGLPEGAAKFAAKDVEDLSNIGEWIEENRGLFGAAGETKSTSAEDVSAETKGEPSVDPEVQKAMQETQAIVPGHFEAGSTDEWRRQVDEGIAAAPDLDSVINAVRSVKVNG